MENFGITDQFLGNQLVVSVTSFFEKHMYIYIINNLSNWIISPSRGLKNVCLYI